MALTRLKQPRHNLHRTRGWCHECRRHVSICDKRLPAQDARATNAHEYAFTPQGFSRGSSMSIEIRILTLERATNQCYIIRDTDTNEAVVIDPVDQAPLIFKTAQDTGWTINLILATHAHFDHVLASKELKELTGAPFYIHGDSIP